MSGPAGKAARADARAEAPNAFGGLSTARRDRRRAERMAGLKHGWIQHDAASAGARRVSSRLSFRGSPGNGRFAANRLSFCAVHPARNAIHHRRSGPRYDSGYNHGYALCPFEFAVGGDRDRNPGRVQRPTRRPRKVRPSCFAPIHSCRLPRFALVGRGSSEPGRPPSRSALSSPASRRRGPTPASRARRSHRHPARRVPRSSPGSTPRQPESP